MADLATQNLHVALSARFVLHGLSLALETGALTVILGPNGAGKSTFLRALVGLLDRRDVTAGTITLDGKPLSHYTLREKARRIAYLPQDREVHWPLPVADVVALGRLPHGASLDHLSATDHAAIARALERADVTAFAERPATALSGGERARVLLARALATEAHILLADEPVAGLDPLHQLTIMAMLRSEAEAGRVVVAVLHDLALAAGFADRVILLKEGRIAADGPPATVLTPATLRNVFGIDAMVETHNNRLVVVPLQPIG